MKKLQLVFALFATVALFAPAYAADTCGSHQHVAVETNDDEGGTVKRCVCDDGWNADGPGAPCKKVKAEAAKKSKK